LPEFLRRFQDLTGKVNDKLDEQIKLAEERARIREQEDNAHRQRIDAILEDMTAEDALKQEFIEKLDISTEERADGGDALRDSVIQDFIPQIASVLKEKAGSAIFDVLSDIERLSHLARTVYQALPMPVRLVVKEQSFVDWVLSHQDKVVEAVKNQLFIEDASTLAPAALPPSPAESLPNAAEIFEPDSIDSAITSTPVN
jgi:hypothetical protein